MYVMYMYTFFMYGNALKPIQGYEVIESLAWALGFNSFLGRFQRDICVTFHFFPQELYLEGIHMFGNQLQELVDMMTEKEIRVQIPVEELDILMSE